MLHEFLFADDMAKDTPTEEKMQKGVDQVSDSCDSYDLTISIKKTEVVYQPAPGKPYKEPIITVKGQRLQVVGKFTPLESTLSRVVHIDVEISARIAKASAAFGRLRGSIWDRSGIRLDTKLKVYTVDSRYLDPSYLDRITYVELISKSRLFSLCIYCISASRMSNYFYVDTSAISSIIFSP